MRNAFFHDNLFPKIKNRKFRRNDEPKANVDMLNNNLYQEVICLLIVCSRCPELGCETLQIV